MNFVATFVINVKGCLNDRQEQEARKQLNLHYVGDEIVNELDENNVMVGKYDDHPRYQEMLESHYELPRNVVYLKVKVGLCEEGRLHFIEIVE